MPDRIATRRRILLGTVQLGMPYGRRRGETILDEASAERILDRAWDDGIRGFDTAEAYGEAAPRLVSWLDRRGRRSQATVVTKVAASSCADPRQVTAACRRFDAVDSLCVLSHGALAGAEWRAFHEAASAAGAESGQSVYAAVEIEQAAALGSGRVQAPGNAVDPRQIDRARECAIAIDIRSIFLQGILLEDAAAAERRVAGGARLIAAVREAADAAGLPVAVALPAVVLSRLRAGDRIVVGIDGESQLDDLCNALDAPADAIAAFEQHVAPAREYALAHSAILDPRQWN